MRRTMHRLTILALAGLASSCSSAQPQNEFEGAVTMNMNMADRLTVDIVTLSKSGKVRQEMTMMGQPVVSIIDAKAGTGLMLMPAQKVYMRIDIKKMAEQAGSMPVPTITPVGTTETIAGHTCENYNIQVPNGTTQMCVAKDLGFYMAGLQSDALGGRSNMESYAEIFRDAFKEGFFPLKMTVTNQGATMTLTVTKIERRSLSDEQFALDVPAGYTEMNAPSPGRAR